MELPPECTDAETLQAKKAPTKASLSRPLELSHFSLHTPRQSAAPSPREGSDGGMSTAIPPDGAEHEQEAALNYEWHFEILNHLPRDTAMALMDHLKSLDSERQKAQRYARELNQSNKELHRRLQQKKDGTRSSKSWGILSLVIVCLVVLSIGAGALMDVRKPLLSGIDTLRGLLADEATQTTSSTEEMQTTCTLEGQTTLSNVTSTTGAKSPEEETLQESVTKEVDPKIQQLQTENIQMRVQLERLWIMIEEAEKKGEDQVCWKL